MKNIKFIGCEGETLSDRKIKVNLIKSFGFAAFEGETI